MFQLGSLRTQSGGTYGWGGGFHLADPGTGDRVAAVCDEPGWVPWGPITSGVFCRSLGTSGSPRIVRWDGASSPVPVECIAARLALSPDASRFATQQITRDAAGGCRQAAPIVLVDLSGHAADTKVAGFPEGWLDDSHLVFDDEPDIDHAVTVRSRILDLGIKAVTPAVLPGEFVTTVPAPVA